MLDERAARAFAEGWQQIIGGSRTDHSALGSASSRQPALLGRSGYGTIDVQKVIS